MNDFNNFRTKETIWTTFNDLESPSHEGFIFIVPPVVQATCEGKSDLWQTMGFSPYSFVPVCALKLINSLSVKSRLARFLHASHSPKQKMMTVIFAAQVSALAAETTRRQPTCFLCRDNATKVEEASCPWTLRSKARLFNDASSFTESFLYLYDWQDFNVFAWAVLVNTQYERFNAKHFSTQTETRFAARSNIDSNLRWFDTLRNLF